MDAHLKLAYGKWATSILQAMHDQRIEQPQQINKDGAQAITAHIYKNKDLELACRRLADEAFSEGGVPVFHLTLDEQISGHGELGISRLFDCNGDRANTPTGEAIYVGRPEKSPIDEQLQLLAANIRDFKREHSIQGKVPVVLLEDNVRHARMLNQVVQLLNQNDTLTSLMELKGIATEFCCASPDELSAIKLDGDPNSDAKSLPTEPVVSIPSNFRDVVDVTTPRDFFFDGLVVKLDDGSLGRMPSFYAEDVQDLCTNTGTKFVEKVKEINLAFCKDLETKIGLTPQLAWFRGGRVMQALENDTRSESGGEYSVELSDSVRSLLETGSDTQSEAA